MNETINIILRTILVLITLFILFKIMGKKQVSQMSMFDYITGITIGSIAADISLDIEKNFIAGIVCLIIFCLTATLLSYISLKSIKIRNFIEGKEVILIEKGIINKHNMSKNKITINDLITEARINGYFNLKEINNAILEPNGKISFELIETSKPSTKKDINIKSQNNSLVYNIIIDGQIITENLKHLDKTKKWLYHELKIRNKNLSDILLLTMDEDNNLCFFYNQK